MQTHLRTLAALLVAAGTASAAHAQTQPQPIELGIDAGIQFGLDDPSTTIIGIPAQALRAGFFLSPRVSVEPAIALSYFKVADSDGVTTFQGDVGLLLHHAADRARPQYFARPFAGLSTVSGGGDSDTQFRVGVGVGVKTPITPRLSWRLEGLYAHGFSSGDNSGGNALGVNVGLSFFTR